MTSVGTVGGYTTDLIGVTAPSVGKPSGPSSWTPGGLNVAPYSPGPISWPGTQPWPLNGSSQLNAQDLNQQVSLPVNFLSNRPTVQLAQQVASQSLVQSSYINVTWDTELSDPWGFHRNPIDASLLTCPADCDGYYLVRGGVPINAPSDAIYRVTGWLNGNEWAGGESLGFNGSSAGTTFPSFVDLVPMRRNDEFQLSAYQSAAAPGTTAVYVPAGLSSAQYPSITMRWVAGIFGTNGLTPPNIGAMFQNPVASSDFNSYVTNSVNYLAYVPVCRVYPNASQSIPTATNTVLTSLTNVTVDNYGAFNTSTSTWTCQVPGIYLVSGQVSIQGSGAAFVLNPLLYVTSGGSSNYWGRARVNGVSGAGSPYTAGSITHRFRFNAGDTVQLATYQNSGGSIPITGTSIQDTRLITVWQSR